jgi:hypothetical protein
MQTNQEPVEERIERFEKNPANALSIKAFEHWKGLTEEQKTKIWALWKAYYDECAVSEAAAIFFELKEAMFRRDKGRLNELLARNREIRENREYLQKPKSIDPYWYMGNQAIFAYRMLKNEQSRVQGESIF